jgi:hypothetical protein
MVAIEAPQVVLVVRVVVRPQATDQIQYQRINEDNAKDRRNGEIELTVTV